MPRVPRPNDTSGSEKWLRLLIDKHPELLNDALTARFGGRAFADTRWLSPIREDDYAEYYDEAFLERLGVRLEQLPLREFWPQRGPQWDGLGKTSDGKIVLVEAKAYIEEMVTLPSQAGEISRPKIQSALNETKDFLRVIKDTEWSGTFYQYTNRLAHLYLLRERNGIEAYMAFVYFTNAPDVRRTTTEAEWNGALRVLHSYFGVGQHRLSAFVAECFIDTSNFNVVT